MLFFQKSLWSKKEILVLAVIVLFGLALFSYKITHSRLDYIGDYQTYIATSQLFSGQSGAKIFPERILKPLEPALTALVAAVMPSLGFRTGFQGAFLFWVGVMYVLLVVAAWVFFKEFIFDPSSVSSPDSRYFAMAGTALFALSYPMLRYGLDAYTETGALLFYVLGLLGCLYFLRNPSWKILFINLAIDILGFFWKEYSILPLVILNLIILLHPFLKGRTGRKIKYLVALDVVFAVPNIIWQTYVKLWLHYDYVSWYIQGGVANWSPTSQAFLILKSLFALLIVGWVFVPWSIRSIRKLENPRKFLFVLISVVPLVVLFWGAVSSRLFYVLMPSLCLACVWGIKEVFPSRKGQVISLGLVLISGFAWLAVNLKVI